MRALLFVSLLLPGCILVPPRIGGGDRSYSFDDARGLVVDLASGSVTARNHADPEIRVEWSGGGFGDAASPFWSIDDDDVIHLDANGGLLGGGDLTVWLPEGAPFGAWLDRGDVEVDFDAPADVLACIDIGNVDLSLPAGAYDLDLGDGVANRSVTGIEDDPTSPYGIKARVGAGNLTIRGW